MAVKPVAWGTAPALASSAWGRQGCSPSMAASLAVRTSPAGEGIAVTAAQTADGEPSEEALAAPVGQAAAPQPW